MAGCGVNTNMVNFCKEKLVHVRQEQSLQNSIELTRAVCVMCNGLAPRKLPSLKTGGEDTPGGTGDQSAKRTCDICKAVWPQLPTTMSTPASQAANPHKHDAGNVEIDVQKHHTRAVGIL